MLRQSIMKYADSRTTFIKEMVRFHIFQTHFYDHRKKPKEDLDSLLNVNEHEPLSMVDEEIITEIAFIMEEQYYPQDEVILNVDDQIDSMFFVVEGEVHVTQRSHHN